MIALVSIETLIRMAEIVWIGGSPSLQAPAADLLQIQVLRLDIFFTE